MPGSRRLLIVLCVAGALAPLAAQQRPAPFVLSQLTWFDRTGKPLGKLGPLADHGNLEISPDGSRVAVAVTDRTKRTHDIWMYDTASGDRRQFTSGAAYLKALHEATSAASVDESFRDAVEQRLVPLSVRHRWVHRDNASLEFVALVRRERLDDVRAAGEALRATRVPFLLSGPWPLEVFADDDRQ